MPGRPVALVHVWGFLGAFAGLLLWTALACTIAIQATRPSIPAALALGLGEIGLLAACAVGAGQRWPGGKPGSGAAGGQPENA